MRYAAALLFVVGCSASTESRGATARAYEGGVPVVFINATPETICGLYLSFDTEQDYGDNWLPEAGLAVGKHIEIKVKPGTYKAKWNTCNDARSAPTVSYAATLVGGTAFPIDEPLQLYAFVSDGTPPTKRGVPRPRMKMIKFIGQTSEIIAGPQAGESSEAKPAGEPVDTQPPPPVAPQASPPVKETSPVTPKASSPAKDASPKASPPAKTSPPGAAPSPAPTPAPSGLWPPASRRERK